MITDFWYLASPYTKFPTGTHDAWTTVCEQAGLLLAAGVPVYAPIVHGHAIEVYGRIAADKANWDFWIQQQEPFILHSKGCIVLCVQSWEKSTGISLEMDAFRKAQKPIIYMHPGIIPEELRHAG